MFIAIYFYDVVLALHIAAIVLAFGVTFAYPILGPVVRNLQPNAVPTFHRAQAAIGNRLIAPAGGVALLAGIYLASDRDYFSKIWVQVPMVILVLLLAMGGAFFSPTERKLAELAERDVAAGDGSKVTWSPEYEALHRRWQVAATIGPLLVLVAIFFMAAKPGGY